MLVTLALVMLSAAPAGDFEIVVSEGALAGLLSAASPIEHVVEQDTGIAGRVRLTVTLSEPQVRVTNAAIKLTMNYRVRDASGLVDTSGIAKPDIIIVPNASKGVFEARFTRFVVTVAGGLEIPLEGVLQPIEIPGVVVQEFAVATKKIVAEGRGTSVELEMGKVHLKGTMTFKPKGR